MDKVASVDVDQSILGRMLDYGTVARARHRRRAAAPTQARIVPPRHRASAPDRRAADAAQRDHGEVTGAFRVARMRSMPRNDLQCRSAFGSRFCATRGLERAMMLSTRSRSLSKPASIGAVEHAAARQLDAHRIDEAAVDQDLVVHVRAGREAGRADIADHLALAHARAGLRRARERRHVAVGGLVAVGVLDAGRTCRSRDSQPTFSTVPLPEA